MESSSQLPVKNWKFTDFIKRQGFSPILLLIALVGVLIHLLFYNNLGFHRDELLYLSLGDHLDFGYFSVPPLIGWLAFVSTKLFGYTLFAARILPALVGGVMVYLVALIARELKGLRFAQVLAQLGLICSILFLRTFSMLQPVFLDQFFWTLALFLILRYINHQRSVHLYYFGMVLGFGLLNKYNLLFLIMALLLVLPFTRLKTLFAKKEFYWSILIALIIFLPNMLWQIAHHFPVINHMSQLRSSQLEKVSTASFLSDQLLMIYPATLLSLPGLIYLLVSKQVRHFRWVAYAFLVVLAFYLLLHGKGYYSAGIYPLLIAAGALFWESVLQRNIWRGILVFILLLLTWTVLPMGLVSKSPEKMVAYFDKVAKMTGSDAVRRYENNKYHPLPQDYADMLGWDELAAITNQAWLQVRHKEQCIIYAENYGQAGAINIIGKHYNLPAAISFSDNFRYWIPRDFNHEITEFIYINDQPGDDVVALFEEITEIGRITNPLAREFGTGVFLCKKPRGSFNEFWKERTGKVE